MTLPTFLTCFRLIISVLILPFLVFFLVPLADWATGTFLVTFVFALALTDFLDGYLARRYGQDTLLGKLLDPLADKCFVMGALIPLIALGKLYFYWGLIVILRELIITGLRGIAEQQNFVLEVNFFGKFKAAFQYLYILFVVGTPWSVSELAAMQIEKSLLCGMVIFTVLSGAFYCKNFVKQWSLSGVKD